MIKAKKINTQGIIQNLLDEQAIKKKKRWKPKTKKQLAEEKIKRLKMNDKLDQDTLEKKLTQEVIEKKKKIRAEQERELQLR